MELRCGVIGKENKLMNINCKFCGAAVDSSAKICPGCGKVMPAYHGAELKKRSQFSGENERDGLTNNRMRVQTPYAAMRSGRQMDKLDENYGTPKARREHVPENYDPRKDIIKQPFSVGTGSGKQANQSKLSAGLSYIIKMTLIILVGLVLYAVLRVYLVTKASYDFKLDEGITLASKNYGEAFDNYFEEKRWWFDFSINKVTFKGTNGDGEEYYMVFGRTDDGQTAVKELTIDGKKIYNDNNTIMNNYILGTFMAEKKIGHASAIGKGAENMKV